MASFDITRPVVLTGRHVRLEPLEQHHAVGLAAIGLDEEIWRNMPYGEMRTTEDIAEWVRHIRRLVSAGSDYAFAVLHLASGKLAGVTRFMDMRPEHRGLEIGGTWYGAEFRGTIVNTECKYLLLSHAFEVFHCIRVQFKTDLRNERSQRAIEKLGASREGILRQHMILPDGRRRDSVYYSIIDSEWAQVKSGLERRLIPA